MAITFVQLFQDLFFTVALPMTSTAFNVICVVWALSDRDCGIMEGLGTFLPHGGIQLSENCQIRKSLL